MKLAQAGTALVVLHGLTHALHGLAHVQLPVPLSSLQSAFIVTVIFLAPITAAVLLWTSFYRIGHWLLVSSMAGAILFGIYNHFLIISPDHLSHVSFTGWGLLFQITAVLTLIVDGCAVWMSIQALRESSEPLQS